MLWPAAIHCRAAAGVVMRSEDDVMAAQWFLGAHRQLLLGQSYDSMPDLLLSVVGVAFRLG